MRYYPLTNQRGGCTILEAAITSAIVAVFVSGLYESNWRALSLLKSGIEGTAAARLLESRLEHVRTSTWTQITDPNYIASTILPGTSTSSAAITGALGNLAEKIDINQYPLPASCSQGQSLSSTIEVVRNPSGTVVTASAGDGSIPSSAAIRVDVTAQWNTTLNSTMHSRMMSTIISKGGILGRNQ